MSEARHSHSWLGLGCSDLGSTVSYRQSCRLLEQAYALGIRHFDLAPVYGDGKAEKIVGDVFGAAHTNVVLVTKAGIGRPPVRPVRHMVRRAFLPLKRALPGVWRTAARASGQTAAPRGQFDATSIRASLAESLRLLRVDRVQSLLLHEVTARDITESLLAELNGIRQSGAATTVGLATDVESTKQILQAHGAFEWAQVNHYWGAFSDACLPPVPGVRATHRVLRSAQSILAADAFRATISCAGGAQALRALLASPTARSRVLLRAAALQNRSGPVLASTSRAAHLVELAAAFEDESLDASAAMLNSSLAATMTLLERDATGVVRSGARAPGTSTSLPAE